jgi:hypothetical protein
MAVRVLVAIPNVVTVATHSQEPLSELGGQQLDHFLLEGAALAQNVVREASRRLQLQGSYARLVATVTVEPIE